MRRLGPSRWLWQVKIQLRKGVWLYLAHRNLPWTRSSTGYGNGDMFVNSVDWAAEQESLASITPKNTTERTFNPPSQLYWILILLTSIFIIPGLIVLAVYPPG